MENKGLISWDSAAKRRFRRSLLAWFDRQKRDLPWRADRDPYRIWVSEIMLQQTRVAAVIEHYQRFLRRFPSVEKLARARETSVLASWSGLGYYRRARMLHAAARKIVKERRGNVPTTAERLRTLPGIGRYTAAAIASIAFNEPVAVVDGNVERVLQRVTAKRLLSRAVWQVAGDFIDQKRPGDFNQAMMELGATVCLPRQPKCPACPIYALCATRGEYPRAKTGGRQQKRDVHYALNIRGRSVLLQPRPSGASLMPGMWELPEIQNPNGAKPCLTLRHSITVTDYVVKVFSGTAPQSPNSRWIPRSRLATMPLTGLARKILRERGII